MAKGKERCILSYYEMTRDELFTARARLQNTTQQVNTILRENKFYGFNTSFHEGTPAVSTQHEERAFAIFSDELVCEISKGTEFWRADGCQYQNLHDWCLSECSSYQSQVYAAIHALKDDIALVTFLLERCEV